MLLDSNRLASYLASKICHDLVSPVGAASSALEFMQDSSAQDMREQAEQLLEQSTSRSLARLQFLRYAFGSMGMSKGAAELHEAKAIAEGYVGSHKGEIEWNINAGSLSFAQVRVMMNVIMLGLACLSRDGLLKVTIDQDDTLTIKLVASGKRARMAPDVRAALSNTEPEDGWDPRTIQPYFMTMIVQELGGSFRFTEGEETVSFTVTGL
ncbi:histidine phosphotransferase family protein [Ponticaulis koreensis]|uniref:histidine phosphotransferase family protein n=1 Tax=Ponticaulis koreensis TaxID=1123045 RepID=UPI0003B3E731|nr:histidine phosphotransferase family protein [Ponticaulis koreensis]